MPEETSKIIFKRGDYETFEDMLVEIANQTAFFLRNNYMVTSYRSIVDKDLFVMEFASADPKLSELIPVWVTPNEALGIVANRELIAQRESSAKDGLEDDLKNLIKPKKDGGSDA